MNPLPDCSACHSPVVTDMDVDGGVEVCTNPDCAIAQPVPGVWTRAEVRRRVAIVHAAAVRGDL